jgi:tagatose-1,6-bisphosphate aldolase non-catalytic subunit AgaZ/GatZ
MQLYGLSDRLRYYWPNARIAAALAMLTANLTAARPPPGLVSQFAGALMLDDESAPLPGRIIQAKVGAEVSKYRRACGLAARL